jgi:hypothetical protein
METVAGEIATLIPVTGSLHAEDDEDEVDVLVVPFVVLVEEVDVVHVMAVLVVVLLLLLWQETRVNTPTSNAKTGRRLTAPLSLCLNMPIDCGSVANSLPKSANYISSCLPESLVPVGPVIPKC